MRVDSPSITELSLCSGVGWLSLGIELAAERLGWPYRCLGHCERDSYAAAVLLARMEDSSLGRAPVFAGNLEDLDARSLRGHVNLISAGFPCQPFSVAGQQRGHEDERNVWPGLLRIFREVEPKFIFLENVPGIAATRTIHHRPDLLEHLASIDATNQVEKTAHHRWHGERHRERLYGRLLREQGIPALLYVVATLEELGYVVEAPLFLAASDVGASHRRERVFILAYRAGGGTAAAQQPRRGRVAKPQGGPLADSLRLGGQQPRAGRERVLDDGAELAEPTIGGFGELRESPGCNGQPDGGDGDVVHAEHPESRSGVRQEPPRTSGRDRPAIAGNIVGHARSLRASEPGSESVGQPEQQPGRAIETGGRCDDLADASGAGHQERTGQRRNDGSKLTATERTCREIFAPGPSDPLWGAIIAESPWLAPAVESSLCVFPYGSPLVVDESRADALRCGGNGCVPLQCSVAFIELMRRSGIV